MRTLLEVRKLNIRYSVDAVNEPAAVCDVSFDIARGEIVGLMGESGCGKTSIGLALLGLLPRDKTTCSGSVLLGWQDLLAMKERELRKIRGAGISMVFQEPEMALNPVMRAGDQVAEVIHAHRGLGWRECREEACAMLHKVGLEDTQRFFRAYPHQLSGGERQRVVLAQALACQPALLVADEPTASLDARGQTEFLALLRQMNKELGVSVLLISHSPDVQASLVERLLVMAEGCIVEEGDFSSLYRRAKDPRTRAMLSAAGGQRHREVPAREQVCKIA